MIQSYKKGVKIRISDNFYSTEFDCHCSNCKETLINDELVLLIEEVRKEINTPIKINSGYRCEDYQRQQISDGKLDAAKNSQHVLGNAADIVAASWNGSELFEVAKKVGFWCVGVGHRFIHVDLRRDKERVWYYNY